MSDSRCKDVKETVRPIFEFGRDVCRSAEAALRQEDRLPRTVLPRLGNAIGRSQLRVIRLIEKRPVVGLIAPALEAVVASQAAVLGVAVHAQEFTFRAGAKVVGECADAFESKIEGMREDRNEG